MKTINLNALVIDPGNKSFETLSGLLDTYKKLAPDPNIHLNNLRELLKKLNDRDYPKTIKFRSKSVTIRWMLERLIRLTENVLSSTAYTSIEKAELCKELEKYNVISHEIEFPTSFVSKSAETVVSTRQRTDELMNDTALAHHRF